MPLDLVIEFKRGVYEMALTELARYLPRISHHNRYLRAGLRGQRQEHDGFAHELAQAQPVGELAPPRAPPAAEPAADGKGEG